ncbi:MAG: hypothetical protein IKT48_06745, partial [Anaerotignum sp.]|nr:hypothetical protein [Anaerotignum sp.]
MENNQNPIPNRPQRKQLAPRDMLIVALIILGITRLDFANLNSFHVLLLFLMFLLLVLRWGNMRKEALRKQAMERYRSQYEDELIMKAAQAESVAAEDMTVN